LSARVNLSGWAERGALVLLYTRDQLQTLEIMSDEITFDDIVLAISD
jgi:hypothetical protein